MHKTTSDAPENCPGCTGLWTSMESVKTGDCKALDGWEDWCFCRKCDIQYFYPHYKVDEKHV